MTKNLLVLELCFQKGQCCSAYFLGYIDIDDSRVVSLAMAMSIELDFEL